MAKESRLFCSCLVAAVIAHACTGCNKTDDAAPKSQAGQSNSGATSNSTDASIAEAPAVDAAGGQPASVADAARVLDLSTFPLLPAVKGTPARVVASLSYQAEGESKTGFEFQRRELQKRKFTELPNGFSGDDAASGQFLRDGFHVSVSVSAAGEPGLINVFLQNHGNVDLAKLPVPADARLQYTFPGVASFETDASLEKTAAAVKKLLTADGWQPYGSAGDSMFFKQNAIELDARVLAPPAQPGKTVITFTAVQLSADLPVPPEAESVQYSDALKQVNADVPGEPDDVIRFYRETLGRSGWKATTEQPIRDQDEQMLIFRNPGEEMLTLKTRKVEGRSRSSLQHLSRAEIEELDRQFEEFKKKQQQQRDDQESPQDAERKNQDELENTDES
jgi:hypothetical protein